MTGDLLIDALISLIPPAGRGFVLGDASLNSSSGSEGTRHLRPN